MAVIQNMSTEAGDIVPSVTLSNAAQSSSFAMQTDFSSYRIKVDVSGARHS